MEVIKFQKSLFGNDRDPYNIRENRYDLVGSPDFLRGMKDFPLKAPLKGVAGLLFVLSLPFWEMCPIFWE